MPMPRRYDEGSKTARIPLSDHAYTYARTSILPEVIEKMLVELEPRKDKARAKEAYELLMKLKKLCYIEQAQKLSKESILRELEL